MLLFFGLLLYLVFVHRRKLRPIFTAAPRFRWGRFFWLAALLLVLLGIVSFVPIFIDTASGASLQWNFKPQQFFPLLALSILLIPIQAAAEELIFRVYALQGLYARTGKIWLSLVLSAVFFAVVHGSNPEIQALGPAIILYYFMAGFFLALISVKITASSLHWLFTASTTFLVPWSSPAPGKFFIQMHCGSITLNPVAPGCICSLAPCFLQVYTSF
jgi:membrane protease YdiL (CAAX protease family)